VEGNVEKAGVFRVRTCRLVPPALRVIRKIYQTVAIVNLNVEHSKQCEPEGAGNFSADVVADMGKIECNEPQVFLFQVTELQNGFVGGKHVFDFTADPFDPQSGICIHLGHLASGGWSDEVGEGSAVEREQLARNVPNRRWHQQQMTKPEYLGV